MSGADKMVCVNCGYIYDPRKGDEGRGFKPETSFDELPEDWTCPICYSGKSSFDPL